MFVDEVDCTITWGEGSEFVSVLDEGNLNRLADSGVRLFCFNTDLFDHDTLGLSGPRKRVVLGSGLEHTLLVSTVRPSKLLAVFCHFSTSEESSTHDNHCIEAFRIVCDSFTDLKVSLEPKPSEPRRFFIHNTTGTAILIVRDIDRENMGLTLDFGHCLMATENPGQSAALAGQEGKLFGVQLNDGFVKPGSEDGLALGTVIICHPARNST